MNRSRSLLATLLRRYVRSNLDLHVSGPVTSTAALSPLSEERTAIDGKSPLCTSLLSPSMFTSFARSLFAPRVFQLVQTNLILLFTDFLPVPFACECFLHAFLFAGFQVKGVALDLFNNVFRLHLPLETTKSILQGLAFLNTYFCQDKIHLPTCQRAYVSSICHIPPICAYKFERILSYFDCAP